MTVDVTDSASSKDTDDATDGAADSAAAFERDLGEQPLAVLMRERGFKPASLVSASTEQVTHRMVARAMKGRRLTSNTMNKVLRAWNAAAGTSSSHGDLFNYDPRSV